MSADLNLIPPPDLEKKKAANRRAITAGIIIAALLLVGYFGVLIPLETKAKLKQELDANRVDENEYQALAQEYQALSEALNAEKTWLEGLSGNLPKPFGWAGLLTDIEGVMPAGARLKTMEYKDRGLHMLGIYVENTDLSRLVVKLRGLEQIESARILSVTYNREESGWEFEIQCDLPDSVYPQEPAADTVDETEEETGSGAETPEDGEPAEGEASS